MAIRPPFQLDSTNPQFLMQGVGEIVRRAELRRSMTWLDLNAVTLRQAQGDLTPAQGNTRLALARDLADDGRDGGAFLGEARHQPVHLLLADGDE